MSSCKFWKNESREADLQSQFLVAPGEISTKLSFLGRIIYSCFIWMAIWDSWLKKKKVWSFGFFLSLPVIFPLNKWPKGSTSVRGCTALACWRWCQFHYLIRKLWNEGGVSSRGLGNKDIFCSRKPSYCDELKSHVVLILPRDHSLSTKSGYPIISYWPPR